MIFFLKRPRGPARFLEIAENAVFVRLQINSGCEASRSEATLLHAGGSD